MKTEALPGSLHEGYVKRGRKRCGPYLYRYWKEAGKTRKAYVRPEDVERVRRAIEEWRRVMHEARQATKLLARLDAGMTVGEGNRYSEEQIRRVCAGWISKARQLRERVG